MCGEVPLEIRLDWSRMSSVTRACLWEGCDRAVHSRGYCNTHCSRAMSTGVISRLPKVDRTCTVPGCEKRYSASGYCQGHYTRWRKGQDLSTPLKDRAPGKTCSAPNCGRPHYGLELCVNHYMTLKRHSLTLEELFSIADASCQICSSKEDIVVDHDHSCCPGSKSCGSCRRGFLCASCNKGLGAFRDNREFLSSAIQYLSRNAVN